MRIILKMKKWVRLLFLMSCELFKFDVKNSMSCIFDELVMKEKNSIKSEISIDLKSTSL